MVSLTNEQKDNIYNALVVGMAPEDAYIYAKLSPHDIVFCTEDEEFQAWIAQTQKHLEFSLLTDMKRGAEHQLSVGKTDATQWLLERLYPRYAAKAVPNTGTINFILGKEDTSDIETVVKPRDEIENSADEG